MKNEAEYLIILQKVCEKLNRPVDNEPSAGNAGVSGKQVRTCPASERGKEKKQQVGPALRLLAGRQTV